MTVDRICGTSTPSLLVTTDAGRAGPYNAEKEGGDAGDLGALAAFVLAIVAKIRHERWTLLWLPLGVLPAVIVFLVLGEAFWWE